jgi:triacylglycerol esterase/lipase EstA (alpha/beta hydrolase family)
MYYFQMCLMGVCVWIDYFSTGTIAERAAAMNEFLSRTLDKNTEVNFLAHSMGGLDCRHLITHINPTHYRPISLTTLSTPHRGSSFMDFCRDYLGLGRISSKKSTTSKSSTNAFVVEPPTIPKQLNDIDKTTSLSSTILTHTMLARTLDTPAYANLTTSFLQNTFNPMTPDSPQVEYYSFGAVIPTEQSGETGLPIWHPLYLPHKVVTEREGRDNDGLVSLKSARWGKFVGKLACDHWVTSPNTLNPPVLLPAFHRVLVLLLYDVLFVE